MQPDPSYVSLYYKTFLFNLLECNHWDLELSLSKLLVHVKSDVPNLREPVISSKDAESLAGSLMSLKKMIRPLLISLPLWTQSLPKVIRTAITLI